MCLCWSPTGIRFHIHLYFVTSLKVVRDKPHHRSVTFHDLDLQPFPAWPSPDLPSTQHKAESYPGRALPLWPRHPRAENVSTASFLFQGSAYTLI